MPNQPKTTARTVRVPDDLWSDAKIAAKAQGRDVSDVVRTSLARYVLAQRRRAEQRQVQDEAPAGQVQP